MAARKKANETQVVMLPTLHPKQQEIFDLLFTQQTDASGYPQFVFNPATRNIVAACGRRFGKTLVGALSCIVVAINGGTAWWAAPDFQRAEPGYAAIMRMALAIPGVKQIKKKDMFEFPGGGQVWIKTANDPQALRGAGLDFAVLDECAFMHRDAWFEAVSYALMDKLGRAFFISTPYGRNWFYEIYQNGLSGASGWVSRRYSTYDNPYIAREEIEYRRAHSPERTFRQEVEAEFIDDASTVFRGVHDTFTGVPQAGPIPGHVYVAGNDWGREHDFTVTRIFDMTTLQEAYCDRFNRVGWDLQRGRLRALFETWRPMLIVSEENSIGGPNIEALQKEGLPIVGFNMNGMSKKPLIEAYALAIETGQFTGLRDETMIAEHLSYEMEILPSGTIRYNAPSGVNDDTVIAGALMWYAATQSMTRHNRVKRADVSGLYGKRGGIGTKAGYRHAMMRRR